MTFRTNLAAVNERIARAAARARRDRSDVLLVAVSKTVSVERLAEALDAGVANLGENRAQELRTKAEALGERVRWHFVGHLQTNKVRHVVGVATLVHAVDRLAVAEAIGRRAEHLGVTQEILVEVNVARDPSKHGVPPEGAVELVEAASALSGVAVRGLMTMPPWPEDPEQSRPHYRRLADLRNTVAALVPGATELSMGMTRDFEVAVEEGATIVRIGEALFGPRS